MMKVKIDKKTVNAMVYIVNESKPLEQPSCFYYSTILEGYQSAVFDDDVYVELLKIHMKK